MTVEAMCGRTVMVVLVLTALLCVSVSGTITARKDRQDVPKRINFSEVKQLLERQKRAATDAPPGSKTQREVLLDEVVLNGTEGHSYAYVHWSGKQTSDVMFILTVKYNASGIPSGLLWRSDNYGSSFRPRPFGNNVFISIFYVSPADPTKMVFIDTVNKRLYRTDDELKTIHNFSIPAASDELYMHPDKSDWMLLYDYYKKELYVTTTFGSKWIHLQSQVYSFEWGIQGYDDPTIIHVEVHPWDSEDAYYKRCTIPYCNATGDDMDETLGPFLANMQVVNEYIFVQKSLLDGSESNLMVSYQRQNFSKAYFPGNIKTKDFQVVDAREGQVFLAVNHGNHQGASLYLSDPTGRYYVLSLASVHHQSFGRWFDVDMHRVKGLNSTYLANQQIKGNSNRLKSLITVNKGGVWREIAAPAGSKCNTSADNCSFVLRLDMERYFSNWILSEENAPGLILAHGHLGRDYEYIWKNLTVFTSNDGGWNWKNSSLKGVYHFNILDQGSLITAVKTGYSEHTRHVYYSYDAGNSWHGKQFKDGMLHVNGVLNEPNINTVVVSVYGHVNYSSPWTMVKLNFSKVLMRKCNNATDYESWMQSDHDVTLQENCLLGQKVIYTRKKPKVVCWNGEGFVRTIQKTACACTDEDFECNFGFVRAANGSCVREAWFDDGYIAPECVENKNYNKTVGYRKVGSGKCVGGVSSLPKYQVWVTAKCSLVKPGPLTLTANTTVVATGRPVLFHLLQDRGSVHSTQYSWRFSQHRRVNVTGLQDARHMTHAFLSQGVYSVQVTASNAAGANVSNVVKVRAEYSVTRVAVFHAWAVRVGDPLRVAASTNVWSYAESSLHYLYLFGDEPKNQKELLTYSSMVTHTFNRTGRYTLSVTGANSISAATKQSKVTVIDSGVVVQLNFSSNVERLFHRLGRFYYSQATFFWLERFRQELTMVLGVNLDRLALSLNSSRPVCIEALILPKPPKASAFAMTDEQIAQVIVDMVENRTFNLFQDSMYIRWLGPINVTYVRVMDFTPGGGSGNKTGNGTDHGGHGDHAGKKGDGINYRAIYIAVPVVAVAGIITVIIIVVYRRRSRATRYSLLSQDGAADPFFDEDDDLPLDMSDARATGRSPDDPILDLRSGN